MTDRQRKKLFWQHHQAANLDVERCSREAKLYEMVYSGGIR